MRWWIAVLLVGCADPSPEEHYDSLKARVTVECGGRRIAPCNDTSPIEPAVACMQDALDQGMVALYAQSQLTTHGFLNTTSIIAADHEVWSFSDLSDELGRLSDSIDYFLEPRGAHFRQLSAFIGDAHSLTRGAHRFPDDLLERTND